MKVVTLVEKSIKHPDSFDCYVDNEWVMSKSHDPQHFSFNRDVDLLTNLQTPLSFKLVVEWEK